VTVIGWLQDPQPFEGGAELDAAALLAACPHDLVMMPPGRVEPGCDMYVAANVTKYQPGDVAQLERAPFVKVVNDSWEHGDAAIRDAVLARADTVVFRSPLHRDRFRHPYSGVAELVPSHVDLSPFRAATGTVDRADRAVWVAHALGAERKAGLAVAKRWAADRGVPLDAYGHGCELGPVPHRNMPELLAGYRWFVHAMGRGGYEPFGRAVVEAWAAGCHLVVGESTGALHWLRTDPDAIETAAHDFWALAGNRDAVPA
jgi:glycosyltransferase involved in cell wall biosynthesis